MVLNSPKVLFEKTWKYDFSVKVEIVNVGNSFWFKFGEAHFWRLLFGKGGNWYMSIESRIGGRVGNGAPISKTPNANFVKKGPFPTLPQKKPFWRLNFRIKSIPFPPNSIHIHTTRFEEEPKIEKSEINSLSPFFFRPWKSRVWGTFSELPPTQISHKKRRISFGDLVN